MDIDGRPKAEGSDPLAFRLLELAVKAGWKPRDCVQFARAAHDFILSAGRQPMEQTGNGSLPKPPAKLEWGSDREIRRRALQTLADQNRTMAEAAEALGVSLGTVAYTAYKLKISFHGPRGRSKSGRAPVRRIKSVPKFASAAAPHFNGKAVESLADKRDVGQHVQRRCPSCNRIFEPMEISHHLCDDCESSNYAGSPQP
jgi:hypothetical protein